MQLKKGICVIALASCMLISACGKQGQQYAKLEAEKQENEAEAVQTDTQETKQNESSLQQEKTVGEKPIPGIICWGDSLTYGHNGEGVSYPAVLEERLKEFTSITTLMDQGMRAEDMMERLFADFDVTIWDKIDTKFECNCSKERVAKAVMSIGRNDLTEMIEEGEPIEVNCHFCNEKYHFSIEELKEMLASS